MKKAIFVLAFTFSGTMAFFAQKKENGTKDKNAIVLPIHLSDSFDDKGKIVAEVAYYSEALLTR